MLAAEQRHQLDSRTLRFRTGFVTKVHLRCCRESMAVSMSLTRPRLSSRLAARASGARQLAVAKPGHAAKVAVQARAELKTETVRVLRAPPLAGSPDCRRRRVPGAVSGLLLTTLPPVLARTQAIETVKTAGIAATLSAAATGALVPEQADAMTQVRARVAFTARYRRSPHGQQHGCLCLPLDS